MACKAQPSVVIGHSSGEIAAAYACGALSDIEALKIAYARGVCISQMLSSQGQKGGMIAIGLGEQDARTFIKKVKAIHGKAGLHVACINNRSNVTVSGEILQINTLKALLDCEKIFARKVNVPAAYHSPQMEPIVVPYNTMLSKLCDNFAVRIQPSCVMVSSVTGSPISFKTLRSAEYWCDNLVSPVQFLDAFTAANEGHPELEQTANVFLEVGPNSAMKNSIQSTRLGKAEGPKAHYASSIGRNEDAIRTFLASIGQLHCLGFPIALQTVNSLDGYLHQPPEVLTDLPSYPFDHTKSYWRESRISKRFRLGDQGHLDLLGKPVADWNVLEGQWRNFIKVSELPWLGDHVVGGALIYPAAGMMVMAIEAAKQGTENSEEAIGYLLKDVKFIQAMVIPDGPDGLETKVHVQKKAEASSSQGDWAEFRIFSYGEEQWTEHCTGFIRQEYSSSNEVDEGGHEIESLRREHQMREQRCISLCEKSQMYKCLNYNGFGLGPAFQTVSSARYNTDGDSVAQVDVYQWPKRLHPQPHIIHPTTLDGALQVTMAAMTQGGSAKIPTAIPSSLRKLWIAKEGLSCTQAQTIAVNGHIEALGRGYESHVVAMSSDLTTVLIKAEGLQSTSISSNSEPSFCPEVHNSSCLHVKLLPALQFMSPRSLDEYCTKHLPSDLSDPVKFYDEVGFVVFKFLQNALKQVGPTVPSTVPSYLGKYMDWAALKQKAFVNCEPPFDDCAWPRLLEDEQYVESVCQRVASFNAEGHTFVHIGRNLPKILRGETDALQFLYEDNLLASFYEEWNKACVGFHQCEAYLELLAHQNPKMKIIEIGAGTGGTTRRILHGLSSKGGSPPEEAMYSSYEFTDISAGFFEKAEEKFGQYPRMSFRTLDVEKNINEQSFDAGTYDLVIAGSVLHATRDIPYTMRNVRSLLKKGGRLIMLEPVHPEVLRGSFLGGLMEGWWTDDTSRPWNPTLTIAQWNKSLHNAGFSGVHIEFPDHVNPKARESSIIITEAVEHVAPLNGLTEQLEDSFCVIGKSKSAHQLEIFYALQESVKKSRPDAKIDFCNLEECARRSELHNTTVVFLQDLEHAILKKIGDETFKKLQNIVGKCKNILWVSAGGGQNGDQPECSIVDGWARSLRSEKPTRRLVVMKLDTNDGRLQSDQVFHIVEIFENVVDDHLDVFYEPEIVEIDGLLHVPRV